jgi:hypothetical protein
MNNTDRSRLIRLQFILDAVPFSASGMATTTGVGAVMFEQDMRALRPYVRKVIEGMVLEGNPIYEDIDYNKPQKLLDAIVRWIDKRKTEGWQNASQYSLEHFLKNNGVEIL